ncbi:MAG: AsnC family transcriptional regulator, partial [Deltaproteobacteria bacterium]|nr:AsnC family transcriptional regulator [Deltaproteobacteria bacterium]
MISKIDFKLILELQKNGTISYSDLAEKLGITSKTVAKRIEGLIKSKFIEIRALPNPFKLGLSANALIAVKADISKIDSVCDKLSDNFYVNLVQPVFGRFDIILIVYFPEWDMLHDCLNKELSRMDGIIKIEAHFIKKIVKRYGGLFEKERYHMGPRIKDADWKLIRELVRDGRASTSDLAKKLGTHVTTVYRRIAMLTREDIIKIRAVPNPAKLGYASNAHILLDVDPDEVHTVCSILFPYPEIHLIMTVIDGKG